MIHYKPVPKNNPRDLTAPPKYHVRLVAKGVKNIDDVSKLISDGSTLRENDIQSVMYGLVNVVGQILEDGYSVQLGELGTLFLSTTSSGVETPEETSPAQIKRVRPLYKQGKRFKKLMNTLDYKRIDPDGLIKEKKQKTKKKKS